MASTNPFAIDTDASLGSSVTSGELFEQHTIGCSVDHHTSYLDCYSYGPEDGTPVILLHGFPENWHMWREIMRVLAGHGYRAIAPSLRGYGQPSQPRQTSDVHYDVLCDDIDAIQTYFGIDHCHLVGHDWGGAIGWLYAQRQGDEQRHADGANRLISYTAINAPHPAALKSVLMKSPKQLMKSWYVFFFQLPWLPEYCLSLLNYFFLRHTLRTTSNSGSFKKDLLDEYVEQWQQPGAIKAMLMYYRALFDSDNHSSTRPLIDTPCLILWGKQDLALTFKSAKGSLSMTTHGELCTFADATHWLCQDKPGLVCQQLLQHFAKYNNKV